MSPALFLRLDPLAGLAVALSPERSWELLRLFWPALALTGATLLVGRFFCGWLCPLGTVLDVTDPLVGRRRAASSNGTPQQSRQECRAYPGARPEPRRPAWLKYAILALVLGAALFGAQALLLLDPLCIVTRTLATVVRPALLTAYNGSLAATEPLRDQLLLRVDPVPVEVFRLNLLVGAAFAGLVVLGRLGPRFWCRNLCPLGALLGLLGRYGLWRRVVGEGCTSCRGCAAACKMDAIPAAEPCRTRQAECIQCYDCVGCCRPATTRVRLAADRVGLDAEVDLGRRQFLGTVGVGAVAGLLTISGWGRRPWHDRLIRPPGAIVRDPQGGFLRLMSEGEFRAKCLRCGQCLKACPTGGLQPAVAEAGLDGFYTPVLVPKAGWCEQNCAACGAVCPGGALIPFRIEEKPEIRIGLATITRDKCLAWREGNEYAQCTVCKEYCSYDAITLRPVAGHDRPVVVDHKCVGCGICESACPVKPEAAIVVHRRGTPDEL